VHVGGPRVGGKTAGLSDEFLDQGGQVAAMSEDEVSDFRPQWMAGQDREIAADISDDRADRLAADTGSDLLWRKQIGEMRAALIAKRRCRWDVVRG